MSPCDCGENEACDRCGQRLTDEEFRMLLDLMMASDPWPISVHQHVIMAGLLSEEAEERGYDDGWVVAYHEHYRGQ